MLRRSGRSQSWGRQSHALGSENWALGIRRGGPTPAVTVTVHRAKLPDPDHHPALKASFLILIGRGDG